MSADLDRLERWLLEVVSHPDGAAAGVESDAARAILPESVESLESVVLPSRELTSVERIGVYADMYFWRLIDVLASDYAAVRRVLGPERFAEVAKRFLVENPSRHYSLNRLGAGFPGWLARQSEDELAQRAFLADLARIERAIEEVFDAANPRPVDADVWLDVPPDAWADARLRLIEAHRLLALDYPANRFFQAHREDRHEDLPGPEPSWLLVYRKGYAVWRLDLDRERYTILDALRRGASLGEAIEACLEVPDADADAIMRSISGWFQQWTADGLFAAVEIAAGDETRSN